MAYDYNHDNAYLVYSKGSFNVLLIFCCCSYFVMLNFRTLEMSFDFLIYAIFLSSSVYFISKLINRFKEHNFFLIVALLLLLCHTYCYFIPTGQCCYLLTILCTSSVSYKMVTMWLRLLLSTHCFSIIFKCTMYFSHINKIC